jgi:thiol-disulfide isomerase/thioredoxin
MVAFTAKWCKTCKEFAPQFVALSERFRLVKFLVVDIDDHKGEIREVSLINKVPRYSFNKVQYFCLLNRFFSHRSLSKFFVNNAVSFYL